MGNESKGFIRNIGSSFAGMWRKSEDLNLKSIRPVMLIYTLAYVFESIFYVYHKIFLHVDTTLFGVSPSMLMYIGHMFMSLVIMLLWSKNFKPLIYVSLAMTVLGFTAFLFLPDSIPKLLCAVLTMAGLGGCVTAARCGFAFAANNAERLLGVVLMLGGRAALEFLNNIIPDGSVAYNVFFFYIYPVVALVGLAFCLLSFKDTHLEVKEVSTQEDSKGLYWALAIFIAYFALDGYLEKLVNISSSVYAVPIIIIGSLVAIALFVFLLLKKNIWHIWNLFLVIVILLAVLGIFAYHPVADTSRCLLKSISRIGWIAVIYLLACAQRRFASLKLLKQCTIVFVIASPITTLSDELAQLFFPDHVNLVFLIYVLVITLIFLMASPSISKYLFSSMWISDLQKQDMALWYEKVEEADRFEKYNLTPREKEVLALLLSANTLRMISGHLGIAQGTVNTHVARVYKKIGVNSKTELFKKFGVAEEPENK